MTKHVHRRRQQTTGGGQGKEEGGQPDGQKSTVIKSQAAQQPRHELTMDSKSRERMIEKQLERGSERERRAGGAGAARHVDNKLRQ